MIMKKQIISFTLGLALVGAALSASAQSFYPTIDTNSYNSVGGPAQPYYSINVGNTYDAITATFTTLEHLHK